jgi:DNA-binding MarR family transcriptional regulator
MSYISHVETDMKPTVSDDEQAQLTKLRRCLETFKLISGRMPLQYVITLLAVAGNEGKGVSDYAQMLGVNTTTMSRHLLDIGARNRQMEEGFGLVSYRANPMELRKHEYYLTPKGKQFVQTMLRELNS